MEKRLEVEGDYLPGEEKKIFRYATRKQDIPPPPTHTHTYTPETQRKTKLSTLIEMALCSCRGFIITSVELWE